MKNARMRSWTLNISVSAALWVLAGILNAPGQGFTGVFDASNFVFTSGGSPSSGSVTATTLFLAGSNSGSGASSYSREQISLTSSYKISFSWSYVTTDADGADYDRGGYGVAGTETQLSSNSGPNSQSGTVTNITVTPGLFGFYIYTTDNRLGNATITITNFTWTLLTDGSGMLSNYSPVFTATDADYQVTGEEYTSDHVNRVNSLTFNPGSSLEVFHQLIVTSGLLTVNEGSASLTGSGDVQAPNGLTKLGEGLLNVLNTIVVNGNATVAEGTLAVNGTLTAQDVIVQLGAWLKGSGAVLANVINNGGLAPGNSPGTLTIGGDFAQTESGLLQIEVGSQSNFDRLVVGGNASLAGTLEVASFEGYDGFRYGQQYAFLQAGSISGQFDTITMPQPGLYRGRFLTQGGTGILVVAPASYELVAETDNQQRVARALDSFIGASGDRDAVSAALDVQTAGEYPAAFDAIAPGYYQTLTDTTIEQAVAQSQMVAQRLSAVRLGARGFQAMGMEATLKNDKDGKSVLDAKEGKDILTPGAESKWGVWTMGNGIFAKVTNVSQIPTYRFQSGGFLAGADYAWSENLVTGVFGGYQGTYAKYANGSMQSVNSALFGGYATYQNEGFYSDAIVSGGYNGYVAKRAIQFSSINRTARANPNGGQLTTYLDLGYDWKVGGFTFGPLLSGQYTYSGISPFTEDGADSLDLRVEQQNANSLRTNVGGRIAYTWNVTDKIALIPEVRMFWQHEYLQNPTAISASLDGGAGASFDYLTTEPGRDSVFAGAGVSAALGDNLSAFVYYNTDFASQDYLSQMISTGLGWKF